MWSHEPHLRIATRPRVANAAVAPRTLHEAGHVDTSTAAALAAFVPVQRHCLLLHSATHASAPYAATHARARSAASRGPGTRRGGLRVPRRAPPAAELRRGHGITPRSVRA